MSAEKVETVRRLFRAVKERNCAGVLEAYDLQVIIQKANSRPYGGDSRGLNGARRHAYGFLFNWNDLQSPEEKKLDATFLDAGESVVTFFRQRTQAADGKKIDSPVVGVYGVRGGRMVEARMFRFDTVEISAFLKRGCRTT